jgi:D-tagatose-1,6-bisphosphate aldolase subunit GatZ/KbaZ
MKSASENKTTSVGKLLEIVQQNRVTGDGGVYSVCSAHPAVIDAAVRQALTDSEVLCVESTSSQVNQEGGYTGQKPQEFANFIHLQAKNAGLPANQIVLGGDHLGPFPWRNHQSSTAMEKARELVRACVLAGYQKIHLDASMPCADDPTALDPAVVAKRAAVLAEAAESASLELPAGSDPVVYVIGTEVPAPGGETLPGTAPAATHSDHVQQTLDTFQSAFAERNLAGAWKRVIALVVQPGVEFGDDVVFLYDRAKAQLLSSALPKDLSIVYEAHSTDYQTTQSLTELVEDHFAILKVGPWLTFAFREAVFALSAIETELLGEKKAVRLSAVRGALESAMLRNPMYWKSYYHGDEEKQRFARAYSYSDRCRYYWPEKEVQQEVERLLANLKDQLLPSTLISQYLPLEYELHSTGLLELRPRDLTRAHIQAVLQHYSKACGHSH